MGVKMNPRLSFWKSKTPTASWGFGLVWRGDKKGWVHYPMKWHGFRKSLTETWKHYKHARKYGT
tara:strand:- start:1249 stop:1440 length:192 start_codon:yes stop_codon:yes gene_type:complete